MYYTFAGIDEPDAPDLHGSIEPSPTDITAPTSTIVYNGTDPVTSLYIYEYSSSELVTRSFLAGDDYIIKTSPTIQTDEMGRHFKNENLNFLTKVQHTVGQKI